MSKFMIVVPCVDRFEVGLADGIYPWEHMATCEKREDANRICTLLAMHFKVRAHNVEEGERTR